MKRLETADLSVEELEKKFKALKDELFHLRFKYATSQLENHAQLRAVRKDIARCLGAITARERAEAAEGGAS